MIVFLGDLRLLDLGLRAEVDCFLHSLLVSVVFGLGQPSIEEFEHFRAFDGLHNVDFSSLNTFSFLVQSVKDGVFQQFSSGGPHFLLNSETHVHESPHLLRVLWCYFRVFTFSDLAVQRGEIAGLEWHLKCAKFINQTSQGPNIAFAAIFLSRPNFRTCVVRRSSLRRAKAVLCYFRHIEVSEFCDSLHEENIGALDISMDYIVFM